MTPPPALAAAPPAEAVSGAGGAGPDRSGPHGPARALSSFARSARFRCDSGPAALPPGNGSRHRAAGEARA
jgi:hypothetical protein